MWRLLEDVRDAGTTILLTTHALDEAERLAHRASLPTATAAIVAGMLMVRLAAAPGHATG